MADRSQHICLQQLLARYCFSPCIGVKLHVLQSSHLESSPLPFATDLVLIIKCRYSHTGHRKCNGITITSQTNKKLCARRRYHERFTPCEQADATDTPDLEIATHQTDTFNEQHVA